MNGKTNRRQTGQPRERGAVLAIAAITMIMMLLFSAMVIDIGLLMTERRQDQSAADAAATAGYMDRYSPSTLATTVVNSLNSNLDTTFTTADLNTCPAETLPTSANGWSLYTGYNCLAHNNSYTEIRVRIPTQELDTVFAGLGGVETIEHSAFAQAGAAPFNSNVLPYAITSSFGSSGCLKVGAANVPDASCSGSSSGNFGRVVFGLHGNDRVGTVPDCTGTKMYEINLAQGLDHDLSRFNQLPHNAVPVVDTDTCGTPPAPNSMRTDTGNVPQDTYDGLVGTATFTYPDGGLARWQRMGTQSYFQTATVNGITVDATPLWAFIDATDSDDVPTSCLPRIFAEGLDASPDWDNLNDVPLYVETHLNTSASTVQDRMVKLIERCLAHYEFGTWDDDNGFSPPEPVNGCGLDNICTDPVFDKNTQSEGDEEVYDIQQSPRFGYVPVMVQSTFPSGSGTVNIDYFKAVYLQRAYGGGCSSNSCPFVFDPGNFSAADASWTGAYAGQTKIDAISAFAFPIGILPNGLADPDAPNTFGKNRFIRLTR